MSKGVYDFSLYITGLRFFSLQLLGVGTKYFVWSP